MIRCNGIEACRLVCNIRKSISSLDISKSAVFKSKGKVCCRYRCFWGLVHVSSSNKGRELTLVRDQSVLIQRSIDRMSLILGALIPGQAPGTGSDLWEYWQITVEFTKQISLQSMWEKQCQANKQCSPDVALKVNPHAHCVFEYVVIFPILFIPVLLFPIMLVPVVWRLWATAGNTSTAQACWLQNVVWLNVFL